MPPLANPPFSTNITWNFPLRDSDLEVDQRATEFHREKKIDLLTNAVLVCNVTQPRNEFSARGVLVAKAVFNGTIQREEFLTHSGQLLLAFESRRDATTGNGDASSQKAPRVSIYRPLHELLRFSFILAD